MTILVQEIYNGVTTGWWKVWRYV